MIFIGGLQPKTVKVSDAKRTCPNCGLLTMQEKRMDHYISLFFIPLIPVKRGDPFWICERCNLVQDQAGHVPSAMPSHQGARYCSHCQKDFEDSYEFCPYCGRRLRNK